MSFAAPGNVGGAAATGLQQRMDHSLRPLRLRPTSRQPGNIHRPMDSSNSFQHLVVASCFACSVRHHVINSRNRKVGTNSSCRVQTMRIATAANSNVDSEMDVMQSEVARLREEVRVLEVAQASAKEDKRQAIFAASDLDRSGGLDKEELRACIRTHFSIEPDEESMAYIMETFDNNRSGELELHEFDGEAVMHALEQRRRKEVHAKQQQEKAQATTGTAEAAPERSSGSKLWKDILAEGNQDDGIFVRIGCALAYVLPLCDGINFILPLLLILPQLLPIAMPFVTIESLADSIPFGLLIWFLIMDHLSKQAWVPSLLRFNLSQAVALDVRMSFFALFIRFLPSIVGWFVPLTQDSINRGMIQEEQTITSIVVVFVASIMGVLAFMLLATIVVYSVVCSLAGAVPERVPFLSGFLGLHHTNSEAN